MRVERVFCDLDNPSLTSETEKWLESNLNSDLAYYMTGWHLKPWLYQYCYKQGQHNIMLHYSKYYRLQLYDEWHSPNWSHLFFCWVNFEKRGFQNIMYLPIFRHRQTWEIFPKGSLPCTQSQFRKVKDVKSRIDTVISGSLE